ncbi:MAG TPA: Zn-dependent hydrolase [Candidatus Acidoferrales bacterium]|nr:Zn-dependent hydrolase [Candidatus Acidoferrales bacterium]
MTDAARLERRINELAQIGRSDDPAREIYGTAVSRLGLTQDEQRARDLVTSWCLGAEARRDAAANLYLRFAGADANAPVVLVGSHLDSVPMGGRFDGALGVCCAVEAVVSLVESGVRFARPVNIVGWADEEGARFGVGLFGSAAAFGKLPANAAERRDAAGVSIGDALRSLGEHGDPTRARRDAKAIRAYLELHIEQGPRLERAGVPLGVVSNIVGIFHGRVTIEGRQGHAGATVMGERVDALVAASHVIIALERLAKAIPDTVATVGEIAVRPGAKNVIPGECTFSLDIRAPTQQSIDHVLDGLRQELSALMRGRASATRLEVLQTVAVTPLDPGMRDLLHKSALGVGVTAPSMVSGAGHDAQNPALSGVPTGMIFVRSTGGSHTPTEFAAIDDAVLGTRALEAAIKALAAR